MSETKVDTLKWLELDPENTKEEFEKIKTSLNAHGFIKINSPEDLFELKNLIYSQLSAGHFKSDRHKIAFMLSKYECGAFNNELKITRRHFVDKVLAKSWLREMQSRFHPDRNQDIKDDVDFDAISAGINKAYGEMVGRQ